MDLFPKCVKTSGSGADFTPLRLRFRRSACRISRTKRETSEGRRLPHFMRESAQETVRSVIARVTPT